METWRNPDSERNPELGNELRGVDSKIGFCFVLWLLEFGIDSGSRYRIDIAS
jgi:hypothetical protein